MTEPVLFVDASGLLTREAFRFMVDYQLRQAERTQEFLTLVVFTVERQWQELIAATDEWLLGELGRLIGYATRSTDLLSRTADGVLSLLLVGVDLDSARRVIDRISDQIRRYETAPALRISVGAACCPTDAIAADDLFREALSRRVSPARDPGLSTT